MTTKNVATGTKARKPTKAADTVAANQAYPWRDAVMELAAADVPAEDWPPVYERRAKTSEPYSRASDERCEHARHSMSRWHFSDQQVATIPPDVAQGVTAAIAALMVEPNAAQAKAIAVGELALVTAAQPPATYRAESLPALITKCLERLPRQLTTSNARKLALHMATGGTLASVLRDEDEDGLHFNLASEAACRRTDVDALVKAAKPAKLPELTAETFPFVSGSPRLVMAHSAADHLRRAKVRPEEWPNIYRRTGDTLKLTSGDDRKRVQGYLFCGKHRETSGEDALWMIEADVVEKLRGQRSKRPPPQWHSDLQQIVSKSPGISAKAALARLPDSKQITVKAVANQLSELRRNAR